METYTTRISGTRVTLLGTAHNDAEGPEAVYATVADAAPDVIYVELEPGATLKHQATANNDMQGVYEYVQTHSVAVEQYDPGLDTSMLEYGVYAPEEYETAAADASSRAERRRAAADHYPEMFEDVYASREDTAAAQFLDGIFAPQYDRIVIQTGHLHLQPFKNFLSFLG